MIHSLQKAQTERSHLPANSFANLNAFSSVRAESSVNRSVSPIRIQNANFRFLEEDDDNDDEGASKTPQFLHKQGTQSVVAQEVIPAEAKSPDKFDYELEGENESDAKPVIDIEDVISQLDSESVHDDSDRILVEKERSSFLSTLRTQMGGRVLFPRAGVLDESVEDFSQENNGDLVNDSIDLADNSIQEPAATDVALPLIFGDDEPPPYGNSSSIVRLLTAFSVGFILEDIYGIEPASEEPTSPYKEPTKKPTYEEDEEAKDKECEEETAHDRSGFLRETWMSSLSRPHPLLVF